jgi:hypothetical protein
MDKMQKKFNKWLDVEIKNIKTDVAAYCFNIYELTSDDSDYSIELTAFDEYDEYDSDWCAGGNESYASRNNDNELEVKLKTSWEESLEIVKELISDYLAHGKYSEKLKLAEIVGYGFVDGDLETAYKKNDEQE